METKIEEIWKDVVGYEGLYQVSSFGRVKSLDRDQCIIANYTRELVKRPVKGVMLKIGLSSMGYPLVSLSKNGVWITKMVHRLVAIHFIPNPLNKEEINHKDHNPTNNRINNLEWNTRSENTRHSKDHDCLNRRWGNNGFRPVIDISTGICFYSVKEAARAFNIHHGSLTSYLKGRCKNKTNLRYA